MIDRGAISWSRATSYEAHVGKLAEVETDADDEDDPIRALRHGSPREGLERRRIHCTTWFQLSTVWSTNTFADQASGFWDITAGSNKLSSVELQTARTKQLL